MYHPSFVYNLDVHNACVIDIGCARVAFISHQSGEASTWINCISSIEAMHVLFIPIHLEDMSPRKIRDMCPQILREKCLGAAIDFAFGARRVELGFRRNRLEHGSSNGLQPKSNGLQAICSILVVSRLFYSMTMFVIIMSDHATKLSDWVQNQKRPRKHSHSTCRMTPFNVLQPSKRMT